MKKGYYRYMNKEEIYYKKSDDEIEWSAYEFLHHEKDRQWFLVFWIISGGVFASLLIFGNTFGAATMALFIIILYMYALKKPETIHCKLTQEGVVFNDRLFPYNNISSFWILYEPPVKELIIISKHKLMPKISIPIDDANPTEIREIMLNNGVLEKEEEETLSEIIARKLRF